MNKFAAVSLLTGSLLIASVSAAVACGAGGSAGCASTGAAGCKTSGTSCQSTTGSTVSPEAIASFNKESLDLQKQLVDKYGEYRKESLETTPDQNTIAQLKTAITALQASIQKIADKYGIPASSCGSGNGCASSGNHPAH